jgi:NAD(P)-dependent dehydrogenase (short-subunit alcohol dehydrogenase family)
MSSQPLKGKVAVVAGATRGAGRGIACGLGEAGATVYCTGRSSRTHAAAPRVKPDDADSAGPKGASAFSLAGRPETIEETAEMVTARGGVGLSARVDHTREEEVMALFERVRGDQGRLDILVNDVWGGDELAEWGKPFWELSLEKGLQMLQRGIHSHIITSRYGLPLMLEGTGALVVEVTDGDSLYYRGSFFYDLVKISVIRLAFDLAEELRGRGVTALAVTPGFLRSEAMLQHFGVSEANWRDAAAKDPHFIASETPFYVGRAVAALAADPDVGQKAGRAFSSGKLAAEYGFTDLDGSEPDFEKYAADGGFDFISEQRASHARFAGNA